MASLGENLFLIIHGKEPNFQIQDLINYMNCEIEVNISQDKSAVLNYHITNNVIRGRCLAQIYIYLSMYNSSL